MPVAQNDNTGRHKLSGPNYDDFGVCAGLARTFRNFFYHLLQFAYRLLQKIVINDQYHAVRPDVGGARYQKCYHMSA